MIVVNRNRGRITFDECRNMPNRYFHTLYYYDFLSREAEAKAEKEQEKANRKAARSKENRNNKMTQGEVLKELANRTSGLNLEDMEDELL